MQTVKKILAKRSALDRFAEIAVAGRDDTNVCSLLPPLRDRVGDIPLLAEQFLADFSITLSRRPSHITDDALQALLAHEWPGNVRELRNVLERRPF